MWLAMEDFDHAPAPSGYFGRLPARVAQKLPPVGTRSPYRLPLLISAASMLLIASAGGYWFGRQGQAAPMVVEAVMPPRDVLGLFADTTTFASIEVFSQVPDLTPEETQALMADLKKPEADLQPADFEGD